MLITEKGMMNKRAYKLKILKSLVIRIYKVILSLLTGKCIYGIATRKLLF
jgi:hypothetical protein